MSDLEERVALALVVALENGDWSDPETYDRAARAAIAACGVEELRAEVGAVRRETAQQCAEIATKFRRPMPTDDECATAHGIAKDIKKEFGL